MSVAKPGILQQILWWPSELIQDLSAGGIGVETVAAAVVTLGVPYYLYGVPSMEDGVQALAMSYGVAGVSYVASQMVLGQIAKKKMSGGGASAMM